MTKTITRPSWDCPIQTITLIEGLEYDPPDHYANLLILEGNAIIITKDVL